MTQIEDELYATPSAVSFLNRVRFSDSIVMNDTIQYRKYFMISILFCCILPTQRKDLFG